MNQFVLLYYIIWWDKIYLKVEEKSYVVRGERAPACSICDAPRRHMLCSDIFLTKKIKQMTSVLVVSHHTRFLLGVQVITSHWSSTQ